MIALHDRRGLVFWPEEHVAMVRQEWAGRLEFLSADGELAHRPGPVPEGPWREVAPGVHVNPRHAVWSDGALVLPGGYRVASGPLPPSAPVAVPVDPVLPVVGVRASEVLYLRALRRPFAWVTTSGEVPVPAGMTAAQAASIHPDLRSAGKCFAFHARRLRALRRSSKPRQGFLVTMDTGEEVFLSHAAGPQLAASLGLPDPDRPAPLTEAQEGLRLRRLRLWPDGLLDASAEFLRGEYGDDADRLVGDLALQAAMTGGAGFGRSHRGFYYVPVRRLLRRAGLLVPRPLDWDSLDLFHHVKDDPNFNATCITLTRLVGYYRIFTYLELGFREPRPELRRVGRARPWVVVIAEKGSVAEAMWALYRAFGVTVFLAGGSPALVATEFLAARLRRRVERPVLVVSLCDHDPFGYDIARTFAAQLRRYGLQVLERLPRLVRPERFTEEEIRRVAVPIDASSEQVAGRLRRWMEETGGTLGLPLALHADALWPVERVLQAFREEVPDEDTALPGVPR